MGNIICILGKKIWEVIKRRFNKLLSFIKNILRWFSRRPGCSGTSSQQSPQSCPSPSLGMNSGSNQLAQNERSSPLSDLRKGPPQRHSSSSFNINQELQNETEKRSNPLFDMNQETQIETKRRSGPSFDMDQETQNESRNRSGPSFDMNKVPKNRRSVMNQKSQNELQRRSSFLSFTCPQKGCTRTFETIDNMSKHYNSRHIGRGRRNKRRR